MDNPPAPRVASVQVGRPRLFDGDGAPDVPSAIFKEAVDGPVMLRSEGLEGDQQADTARHGGPEQAACFYPAAHFPRWSQLLGAELSGGAFGENLTIVGATEDEVCIGDAYAIGDAVVQVSRPRKPCWKLAQRWGRKDFPVVLRDSGLTGWYARVLKEGAVAAGGEMVLADRPYPQWTVAQANALRYGQRKDPSAAAALAACPLLEASWQKALRETASRS